MTRLYLHIGTHKTGTTSIQAALNETAGDFLYPKGGRHPQLGSIAHHVLAGSTLRNAWPNFGYKEPSDELWDALKKESEGHERIIISCGQFSQATTEDIVRISKNTEGIPTTIVVYLRNHWDFAVSRYKQMMTQGYAPSSFRKHTEKLMLRLNYDMFIERWREHFDVQVCLFDKVKNDLLSDFAQVTGINNLNLEQSRNACFADDVWCSLRPLHRVVPSRRGDYPGDYPPLLQRIRQNIISGRSPGRYISSTLEAIPWIRLFRPSDKEWFKK